ncbi:MAG: sugar-binding protein [Armatimonadota bacterium]
MPRLLIVLGSCWLSLTIFAAQMGKSPTQYLIVKPKTPIVIDGKLNEWDMARTPYTISAKNNTPDSKMYLDPANPVKDDADFSGRAALAWDEQYLYVAGQMLDDHLCGARPGSAGNQGPAGWECDSLMLAIASFRQPLKTNSPYDVYPFLALRYAPVGANPRGSMIPNNRNILDKRDAYWKLTAGSKWAVTETAAGFNVEAAIPWKDLAFTARPGERLYIAFLAADIDPDQPLNQLGWGFHASPKENPLFRLADREDMLGALTLSADELPLGQPLAVRAEVDARAGAVRFDVIRIVDAAGATVQEKRVSMNIPAGSTGSTLEEMSIGKLGRYSVLALATPAGGKSAVVARMPVSVVEPAPPAPVIRNPAGELSHMEPNRISQDAFYMHYVKMIKHGFVNGKDDYLPFLRKHVEPGLKESLRQRIREKNKWGWRDTFLALAMYKNTHDEEYIGLCRDIWDYTLEKIAYGGGTTGDNWAFKFTGATMYRYLTWLQDPKSAWAPPDAEKRYRKVLYQVAAQPEDIYLSESGTHNRIWNRYALLKVARMVAEQDGQPVDARVKEYTDYHEKLFGHLGESDDNSAGYDWVFFHFAMPIYFHTGDWEAFKRDGFARTLLRFVDYIAPGGACPQFGSGNGWHEPGDSIWALELASAVTHDGRYRWGAHRVAEYTYNFLDYQGQQYHLPYDQARLSFALAYIFADDGTAPKAPPVSSRITWRHAIEKLTPEQVLARPGTSPHGQMTPDRWMPDKVILTSGNDPRSLWGMVELVPLGGHSSEVPGNLITLMLHNAGLLAGQGYTDLAPPFMNVVWVEDLDGLPDDPHPIGVEVPIFIEDQAFTFVRVRTTLYQHLPITSTRDVIFYKNGFVLVKDRLKFDAAMKVRLGPCWQTRNLGPQCGANWFNTYYANLYQSGLGLGTGVQAVKNPPWDLLVYFAPRADRKHTVLDRYVDNPFRCSPVQLRQTWTGMTRVGQEVTFTTLLLPHQPTHAPAALIDPPADSKEPKRIEVIRDDDNLTVVKLIWQADSMHPFRYETWVMLNETGKPAAAGPLASDGLLAVVGHHFDGRITTRAVAGGTTLSYRGADETAAARKLLLTPLQKPAELK